MSSDKSAIAFVKEEIWYDTFKKFSSYFLFLPRLQKVFISLFKHSIGDQFFLFYLFTCFEQTRSSS